MALLDRIHNYEHTTFLGKEICQSQAEFNLWEKILSKYGFKRIVDFGTWRGEHSLYLLLFAIKRGAEFYTYDNKKGKQDWVDCPVKQMVNFKKHVTVVDIFDERRKDHTPIADKIKSPGRTILFCDNGNKQGEFIIFSPYLKKGDIVAIHDWKTQVDPDKVDLSDFYRIGFVDKLIFFIRVK